MTLKRVAAQFRFGISCARSAESLSCRPARQPEPPLNAPTASHEALPLRYHTPEQWVNEVLTEPRALLGDHAHLERKAASNALELVNRWPGAVCPDAWVSILAAVARDESVHLHALSRLLASRGGTLPRVHRNVYASALHGLVRRGEGARELLDRLLVSALIEARSCERFELLARCAEDRELAEFFLSLHGSELSHYKVFLHLAGMLVDDGQWQARWSEMLDAEAAIMAAQAPGPRMHSGVVGE